MFQGRTQNNQNLKKKKKRKPKPKAVRCPLVKEQMIFLDYKDIHTLGKFVSQQGKLADRKRTGCSAQLQRKVALAVKHARHMALMPFVAK